MALIVVTLLGWREVAIVDEEAKKRRSMEQVRAHLARADSELLEAAHRLLDPQTDDEEFGTVNQRG